MLRRLLKEPLVQFLALALLIFAVYSGLRPTENGKPDTIIVSAAKIEQFASVFTSTWQRPPTAGELKGLIDDYVKEEIYVREALALGIDKDDTVIRRRLRLKMEFMNDADVDAMAPSDADLEAYLKAHAADFQLDSMTAFQQVFLNPAQHGTGIDQYAALVLQAIRANAAADPAALGDATLLPDELPLTSKAAIGRIFGPEFAETIDGLEPGRWVGPIRSVYGLHIVRVSAHKAGNLPPLGAVHDAVAREWANAKRQELDQRNFDLLSQRYRVIVEESPPAGAAQ